MQSRAIDGYYATLQCYLEQRLFLQLQTMLCKQGKLLPEAAQRMDYWRILDVACGSGQWVRDVARFCPGMEVVGLDIHEDTIEYARSQSKLEHVENALFCVGDMRRMEQFSDNSFDIVHGRFLSPIIAPDSWQTVMGELLRVCRPGGLLIWTEAGFPLTNSVACARWCDLLQQAITVDGHTASVIPRMDNIVSMLRCRVLHKSQCCIDVSAGTDFCRSLYYDIPVLFSMVQPFLVDKEVVNMKEVERLSQDMIIDFYADTFRATWPLATLVLEKIS